MSEEEPMPQEELKVVFVDAPPVTASRYTWRKWLAVGGCAVLLCATVFIGVLIFAGEKFISNRIRSAGELPRLETRSNTMGDPHAPVYVIEYGDFQCPYCLQFWEETEPQLIKEYVNTGKVYFEYRAYAFLGPESVFAAEGAYCAGDQNKFWEYHDTLFANWTGENVGNFTNENLIKYAESLNLNVVEFASCLKNEKHKKTVELDAASAEEDGVSATPTLMINGVKIEGAQPYYVLKEMIENILNGSIDTQDL